MCHIALFIGAKKATNVQLDVENICWMLQDDFSLSVISSGNATVTSRTTRYADVFHYPYPGRTGEAQALIRFLKSHNPDAIMQIISPTQHGVMLGSISKRFGVSYIHRYSSDMLNTYKIHNGWRLPAYYALHNIIGRFSLFWAEKYVTLGDSSKKILTQHGISADNITVLPPPINESRFNPSNLGGENDLSTSQFDILYLGRRSYTKGFDRLVEITERLQNISKDINVHIGGRFNQRPDIADRPNVTLQGFIPPRSIPQVMADSDLLLVTSRKEGLPRVILESLASGTPVLSSNVGDVSYATSNTYQSIDEAMKYLQQIEDLPLDDPTPFYRSTLKQKYVDAIADVVNKA